MAAVLGEAFDLRVYHFLPAYFAIDDLHKRQLKIARIDALNDPFELIGHSAADASTRKAFAKTKMDLAGKVGLLCFSRGWRNPVQWSHYADQHRGVCLGFDVPDRLLTAISYVRKRPLPDLSVLSGNGSAARAAMLKILTTKFSRWRYEDEVRLFVRLEVPDPCGLYFKPFDADLRLREVIVGAASTQSRRDISDAIGAHVSDVTVRKARLAFRTFRVVEQRRAALWT